MILKDFFYIESQFHLFIIYNMMSEESIPEKITQLQCNECNSSLQIQFYTWICQSFKYKPQILNNIYYQLEALINFAEYKYTISAGKPQPGDFLQNIQFVPLSKKQKILWLLLSVIVPYVVKRFTAYAEAKESLFLQKISNILIKIQRIISILQFINYGIFILKGEYRTFTQRILKINMKFIDPNNKRILNFSLMNRMLVWQVYQLFLKTTLPHLFSFVSGPLKNLFYLSSFLSPDNSQQTKNCVFCTSKAPVMIQEAIPCRHKACYYCSKANKVQKCPFCSQMIERWAPIRY